MFDDPHEAWDRGVREGLRQADAFVGFVLHHTLPERAEKRTAAETYEMIQHHPFALAHIGRKVMDGPRPPQAEAKGE